MLGDFQRNDKIEPSLQIQRVVQIGRYEVRGWDLEHFAVNIIPIHSYYVTHAMLHENGKPGTCSAANVQDAFDSN
jgi:hypothetical protein